MLFRSQEWVSKAAPELCAQYPFVRNIPRERVVGSGGSLFCVVPRDPNTSVVVNRIQWNEKAGGYDNVEVLYRSESGEPFLVFACAGLILTRRLSIFPRCSVQGRRRRCCSRTRSSCPWMG